MEKMSQNEQRKLLKALDKAADYTKAGMDPDSALTKVAEEYKLGAPMVERVCEAYNKANAVAYMKSAPEDKRAESYPIAKIANVMQNIFGIQEKAASEITFKKRDYTPTVTVERGLSKTASEKKQRVGTTPGTIAVLLERNMGYLEKLSSEAKRRLDTLTNGVRECLDDITEEVRKIGYSQKNLRKTAQLLTDAFGEEKSHLLINAVNANIEDPARYMPCLGKKAHAVVLPDKPLYKKASELFEKRELMKQADTTYDDIDDLKAHVTNVALKRNPLAQALMSVPKKDVSRPFMDPETGMTGEWDAYEKDLRARGMLYDMMLNDEELHSYSPMKVQQAYNELTETYPWLTSKKNVLRAILRKTMAQGGNMDIYELKDLLTAEQLAGKARNDMTSARTKLSDHISSGSGGGGGGKGGKGGDVITNNMDNSQKHSIVMNLHDL